MTDPMDTSPYRNAMLDQWSAFQNQARTLDTMQLSR